jgi:hypothetical protein
MCPNYAVTVLSQLGNYFVIRTCSTILTISFPDVRTAGSTNHLETAEPNYFSRVQTRGFVYTLRMNILTCAQLKLDDSAEFQIVPTI